MSSPLDSTSLLTHIARLYRADETDCLEQLLTPATLSPQSRIRTAATATRWIEEIRRTHRPAANVSDLLSRFGLSSQEGLALMCLAEALLRIPDRATADALIADKLNETHWNNALGHGAPWAMNVTGWALSITGAVLHLKDPTHNTPGKVLGNLVAHIGQPLIREAIKAAMQWMANQFVTGETITGALQRTKSHMDADMRYSFDMLGEGARTAADAEHYFNSYLQAITSVGEHQAAYKFRRASGISIKLSALHPRYEFAQRERVMKELVPRLITLCEQAVRANIPVTIDAEEAERLQLSLEIADEILTRGRLSSWEGLGFAVQAYQKRAPGVIDYITELARKHRRRLHIRLVKGAYWDSEIKRAQERGWDDFPVFTRKPATDVSYHACANRMLSAMDHINPVFGTHNALTVAHIAELAHDRDRIEFQKLHGMNDDLYRLMQKEGFHCCVYAPVGDHEVLLGYLVRRILENGANSSFVHRLLDRDVPVTDLVKDPVDEMRAFDDVRHPQIRRAPDLYAPERANSAGLDLSDPFVTLPLLAETEIYKWQNYEVPTTTIDEAFKSAQSAYPSWSAAPVEMRAICLERLAELLEQNRAPLMALLINEAKKTIPDALAEIREAVDFCRYYAILARDALAPIALPGPTGEQNRLHVIGRGTFVCISPWNFPLAIFLGQITAALVAGNCVIAKPAPQTPIIARLTTQLIHRAGVPAPVFHLITGGADKGAEIIAHPRVAGVAFTGSTKAAQNINRALANKDGPIVPLIAETGGQNALIVDSSALAEQVVDDVVTSAFRSAGQRCSALRILCLPEATADKILTMLKGAVAELHVGDTAKLETDIGPVIDKDAQQRLSQHVERLKEEAKEIYTYPLTGIHALGTFIAPQIWQIPSLAWLTGEVFGPILHIVRYQPDQLTDLIAQINQTGFGLTGGIHSRIENTVRKVESELHVGNCYVNRSLIGAIVGVQPFGGEGLSGTGPKAGGPHYLYRFILERVTSVNTTAAGGNASLLMTASS